MTNHHSNFLALTMLAFCACTCIAATSTVTRIRPQEITSLETADTVLDRGELVYCRDEANTLSAIALRIGDGTTPGGTIVSDAFALRTPFMRQLRRDEYQVTTYGNVTYSNAAWEIITRRTDSTASSANTGTLVISSAYPIAQVLGTDIQANVSLYGDSLNARIYSICTNYSFSAVENDAIYMGAVTFQCTITGLSVWAWVGTGLLNITNDARTSVLLVSEPTTDDSAISRGWFLSSMANHRGDDWSTYAATSTVDAAWQPIRHNPYLSCVSTGNAGNLVWQRRYASGTTRDLMTLSSTNDTYHMTAYTLGSTSIVVQIDAACPFVTSPVIQSCTNLIDHNWTNLTTTSTWPTTTWTRATSGALLYPVFTLTADIVASSNAFFRVSGSYTNTDSDALTVAVPIYAPSFIGSGASLSGITAAQVGAVPTNLTITIDGTTYDLSANRSWTTAAGGVTFPQATNLVRELTAQFSVTNLVPITNTTRFTVTLPATACSLDDIRIFAANTNVSSRRYQVRLFRRPDFRRTDLAYVATNCLLYATTSTVAQAVGSGTNVVNDASGIVWPIDMYWNDYGGGTNDWMSYTNASSTVLWQCCTNNYAAPAGTLISRVEQFGGFTYFDATGGTGAYFEYAPTTGMTGSIFVVIGGFKK